MDKYSTYRYQTPKSYSSSYLSSYSSYTPTSSYRPKGKYFMKRAQSQLSMMFDDAVKDVQK